MTKEQIVKFEYCKKSFEKYFRLDGKTAIQNVSIWMQQFSSKY